MNKTTLRIADNTFDFDETKRILTTSNGKAVAADIVKISDGEYSVLLDGRSFHFFLSKTNETTHSTVNNFIVEIQRESLRDKLEQQLQKEGGIHSNAVTVRAPMPGLVTKVLKNEGVTVSPGEGILVMEAMKMENEIKSPKAGIIKKIFVKEKQTVEKNDNLFTIE